MQHAVDRNGDPFSEKIGMSRAKPLRGAEGALDIPIFSELWLAIAIDGAL
jgi:hypothetical protein